jgi:hypothetical protein
VTLCVIFEKLSSEIVKEFRFLFLLPFIFTLIKISDSLLFGQQSVQPLLECRGGCCREVAA